MSLFPQALVGYRTWFLKAEPYSMGLGAYSWKTGINQAVCKKGKDHAAPAKDCTCGLHAFYDLEEVLQHRKGLILELGFDLNRNPPRDAADILEMEGDSLLPVASYLLTGVVAGRGEVQLHWNGFRAEEMQIIALLLHSEQDSDPWILSSGLPLFYSKEKLLDWLSDNSRLLAHLGKDLRPPAPISKTAMEEFPARYKRLRSDEDFVAYARELGIHPFELQDIALHFGLGPIDLR